MRQGETTKDCFIVPDECKEPTSASIAFVKDGEIVGTVVPAIDGRTLSYNLTPEYTQGLPTGSIEIQVSITNADGTFIFPNIPIINYPTKVIE